MTATNEGGRQLAEQYHKSPDLITEEELRQYFLYIINVKHYSRNTTTSLVRMRFLPGSRPGGGGGEVREIPNARTPGRAAAGVAGAPRTAARGDCVRHEGGAQSRHRTRGKAWLGFVGRGAGLNRIVSTLDATPLFDRFGGHGGPDCRNR